MTKFGLLLEYYYALKQPIIETPPQNSDELIFQSTLVQMFTLGHLNL